MTVVVKLDTDFVPYNCTNIDSYLHENKSVFVGLGTFEMKESPALTLKEL